MFLGLSLVTDCHRSVGSISHSTISQIIWKDSTLWLLTKPAWCAFQCTLLWKTVKLVSCLVYHGNKLVYPDTFNQVNFRCKWLMPIRLSVFVRE